VRDAKNLASSLASTGANVLWPIFSTPIYATVLGPSMWGTMSLLLLTQLAASLIEQGYSQSIMKDLMVEKTSAPTRYLLVLYVLRNNYFKAGTLLGTALSIAFFYISSEKIQADSLPYIKLAIAHALLVPLICAQIMGAFFRAILLGNEKHVELATINIISQTLKHGMGAMLCFYTHDLLPIISWYTICSIGDAISKYRATKIHAIDIRLQSPCDIRSATKATKPINRNALKMSVAVLLGSAIVYSDRFIVGQILSLEEVGIYAIASTAALGFLQIIYPLGQIILPKIIQNKNAPNKRWVLNINALLVVLSAIAITGIAFVTIGESVITLWLQDPQLSERVLQPTKILMLGVACNATFNIGYWNWLADGSDKVIMTTFFLSGVVSVATTLILTRSYGLSGAATGWTVGNATCMLISLGWLIRSKKA